MHQLHKNCKLIFILMNSESIQAKPTYHFSLNKCNDIVISEPNIMYVLSHPVPTSAPSCKLAMKKTYLFVDLHN